MRVTASWFAAESVRRPAKFAGHLGVGGAVGDVVGVHDGVAAVDICVHNARLPFAGKTQIRPWHRPEAGTEMKTIGTEEHFVTDEVVAAWSRLGSRAREDSRASAPPGEVGERLREIGERRIAAMDEAGLDVQVISLTSPGLHNLPADAGRPPAGRDERPHRRASGAEASTRRLHLSNLSTPHDRVDQMLARAGIATAGAG